jgi:hypothetical protein
MNMVSKFIASIYGSVISAIKRILRGRRNERTVKPTPAQAESQTTQHLDVAPDRNDARLDRPDSDSYPGTRGDKVKPPDVGVDNDKPSDSTDDQVQVYTPAEGSDNNSLQQDGAVPDASASKPISQTDDLAPDVTSAGILGQAEPEGETAAPVTMEPMVDEVAKHPVPESLAENDKPSTAINPILPAADKPESESVKEELQPAAVISIEQADEEHLPESGESVHLPAVEQAGDHDKQKETEEPVADSDNTKLDLDELLDSPESEQLKEERADASRRREREKKTSGPRQYRPPANKPPSGRKPSKKEEGATSEEAATAPGRDRALNVGLRVFIRRGFVTLSVLPKRKPDFPEQLTVTGTLVVHADN